MPTAKDKTPDTGPIFSGVPKDGRSGARVKSASSIAPFGYLTPEEEFGDVERGNPLPYTLDPPRRREVGLERETWRLEIFSDPESNARIEQPISKVLGNPIDFNALLKLGETHGVQLLKGITCNNIGEPLGMGLWEGVPLRVLVWMTKPVENIRRVWYYGYHNDDPKQMFRSSLPIGRVLEDAPGELPVILCYKMNGEYLTGKRGGPVRMIVPEAYGFKSVKWLQRIVLTNHFAANDTYERWNNDVDSPMKTFARFADVPESVRTAERVRISGLAQVGQSGLAKVQWSFLRKNAPALSGDQTLGEERWQDAHILPAPEDWGGGLSGGRLPGMPLLFDPKTGRPSQWPLRYTMAHWTAELPPLECGTYTLRCRSIDNNGIAQPMPRPFAKSGRVDIHEVTLVVA
jgi:DMSO/TMAO reductase YedYZ molybdopterin-dependent catalytic subunit